MSGDGRLGEGAARGDADVRPSRELARQLHALPAAQYAFAVFGRRNVRRVWRARHAMRSIAWLAERNAGGGRVCLRPATTACVLVEDADADALEALAGDGLAPAVVVESGAGALQAWFRLGVAPEPKVATRVAKMLAARSGAEPATTALDRFGLAAGFVHPGAAGGDGASARVRVVEARGRVAVRGDELVAEAETELRRHAASRAPGPDEDAPPRPRDHPRAFLARELARLARRYGAGTERARALAAAARRMAVAGYERAEVVETLAASRTVRRLKAGHEAEYAERVAAYAFAEARRRPR